MNQEQAGTSPPDPATGVEGREPLDETLAETENRQFVIFVCNNEVFAVDMAPVQEIIRVPEVVRVPLAPASLNGLANLRGKVLPIISLRRIFGFAEREHDDSSRAVVIDQGQPLGFVVDRVSSVVGVEPGRIEDVKGIQSTVDTQMLGGLLRDVGGFPMVMVLNFEYLIRTEFASIAAHAKQGSRLLGMAAGVGTTVEDDEDSSDELQLVSFEVAGQEYAIPIENVQEIVQVPEHIVRVPRSDSYVLGIMTLRNRLLPLVLLRSMFALSERELDEQSRIVVVTFSGMSVGVVMDRVNEVLRVPKSAVDVLPPLLAREDDLADISEICRLEQGKRLVSIIATDKMFRHSVMQEALNRVDEMKDIENAFVDGDSEDGVSDDEEQVVIFRLDKEEFGVPIASVQEIVRVPETLTHVPKAPGYVEGVINLRGAVLPVIDQRRRLGMAAVERSDRQRIMVFLLDGVRTGFIVDSVAEVLKIPRSAIVESPELSEDQARLIGRVANLERQKRLIQLLDPSQLIQRRQREELAAIAGD